jgi:hypothetical protein
MNSSGEDVATVNYEAAVKWQRAAGERFVDEKYSRAHAATFVRPRAGDDPPELADEDLSAHQRG